MTTNKTVSPKVRAARNVTSIEKKAHQRLTAVLQHGDETIRKAMLLTIDAYHHAVSRDAKGVAR